MTLAEKEGTKAGSLMKPDSLQVVFFSLKSGIKSIIRHFRSGCCGRAGSESD